MKKGDRAKKGDCPPIYKKRGQAIFLLSLRGAKRRGNLISLREKGDSPLFYFPHFFKIDIQNLFNYIYYTILRK
jgi:hypothetical protein